ncbi:glycosyltransferase family 1 protein [Xylariaceae sp. FL0255]|nr:glycosyltransferase family 1 protein [Xylariaceae sp. FL0255]
MAGAPLDQNPFGRDHRGPDCSRPPSPNSDSTQHSGPNKSSSTHTKAQSFSTSTIHQQPINLPHQQSIMAMDSARDRVIQTLGGQQSLDLVYLLISACTLLLALMTAFAVYHVIYSVYRGTLHLDFIMLLSTVGAFAVLVMFWYPLKWSYLNVIPPSGQLAGVPLAVHYTLLICGSGGHTSEMIQMIERSIKPELGAHRRWAVGKDDEKSYDKVMAFERRLGNRFRQSDCGTFDIVVFGRARYVHQSWFTTPFTAFKSLFDIYRILTQPPSQRPSPFFRYPGVIVTNGPGTGFLFLLVAKNLKFLHLVPINQMNAIFIESWARVYSLSLTGKLIMHLKLADKPIAQHEDLVAQYPGMILAENLIVMPRQPVGNLDTTQ